MNYDAIFQCAHEIANQRMRSGEPISQDDTICVLNAGSGRMYSGINRRETIGRNVRNIQAEEEAIHNMQSAGETVIRALLLISVANGMRLMPSDECLRHVIMLHPDNVRCEILMPDRAVPLSEISSRLAVHAKQPFNPSVQKVPSVSVPLPEASSDAVLLRNKVNSILNVVDDDEEDEEETGMKSFFGGLFKKK